MRQVILPKRDGAIALPGVPRCGQGWQKLGGAGLRQVPAVVEIEDDACCTPVRLPLIPNLSRLQTGAYKNDGPQGAPVLQLLPLGYGRSGGFL